MKIVKILKYISVSILFILMGCTVKSSFVVESKTSSIITDPRPPRPNIFLNTSYFAQSPLITMTAKNCQDSVNIYITESVSEVPIGSENGWIPCVTTNAGINYQLLSAAIGSHSLYIWAKDVDGNISQSAKVLPVKYVPKLIIGQVDETENLNMKVGINSPIQFKLIGGKFYVANYDISRINIYNSIPTSSLQMPDAYIGQSAGFTIPAAGMGPIRFGKLGAFDSDGTKFAIVDTIYHRVLLYNQIPADGDTPADLVLGQENFYSGYVNGGMSPSTNLLNCRGLNNPTDVLFDNGKLIITDQGNNRILIWNTWPTANNQEADLVLGQTSCTTNKALTVNASSLNGPSSTTVSNNKLYVTDSGNHRILIWNTLPTTNGQAADLVLGQTSMTTNTWSASSTGLRTPRSVDTDGTKLIVADTIQNRVLIWNTMPTTNGQAANVVLGQSNFTSTSQNINGYTVSGSSMHTPRYVKIISGDLWVADIFNNRVLKFNGIPATTGDSATFALGQDSLVDQGSSISAGVNAQRYNRPYDVEFINNRIMVSDYNGHRLMSYEQEPAANFAAADWQWGQPSFVANFNRGSTASGGLTTGLNLIAPTSLTRTNNQFFVTDSGQHRVLIFNSLPTSNSQAADLVLGQPNLTTATANFGGLSATSLNSPRQVATDGTRLAIADYSNNRVLIWNTIPTTNNQAADLVIGQPNMSSNAVNNGGLTAATLNTPAGVAIYNNQLIVADFNNNRLLIWSTFPTTNGAAADIVIGQKDFLTNDYFDVTVPDSAKLNPFFIQVKDGKLIVADLEFGLVRIWNSIPTANNVEPDLVYGNPITPITNGVGYPVQLNEDLFASLYSVKSDGSRLWMVDYWNFRISVVPIPEVTVQSLKNTSDHTTQLTVTNCQNRSKVLINESSAVPAESSTGWANCSTVKSNYTYETSAGDGLKTIYFWFKDEDGNILPHPHKTTVWNTSTIHNYTPPILANGGASNSSIINFTRSNLNMTRFYFSENMTTPNYEDANWVNSYNMTYQLQNTTEGTKKIYMWVGDTAGNILTPPSSYTVNYDMTPPLMSSVTLSGYYLGTSQSVMRLTVSSCNDIEKVFVAENSTPPTVTSSGWVTCNTNPHGVTYTLTGTTEGSRDLSIWAQDIAGNISTTPVTVSANFNSTVILGQVDGETVRTANTGIANVSDLVSDGTRWVVLDTTNHRVLLYNGDPTTTAPSIVLGQSDLLRVGSTPGGNPNNTNFMNPMGAAIAGDKLIVSNYATHRIFIWNSWPIANNQPADVVLGQPDFVSSTANNGGRTCASINAPRAVTTDGTRLAVSDWGNNRILIWNTIPTVNNTPADVVLGQVNCTTSTVAAGATGMSGPYGVTMYPNKLVVADSGNHRVLIFNSIPTTNGAAADLVVGQTSFTTSTSAATASGMNSPRSAKITSDNKLIVSDTSNHRILVFNSVPTANGTNIADMAIGQPNLTTVTSGSSQAKMANPHGIYVSDSALWVADYSNIKIKKFNFPLSTNMNATAFLGGFDYSTAIMNLRSSTTTSASEMSRPTGAVIIGTKLVVSDSLNHRVLIWNNLPTSTDTPADVVIGHLDFTTTTVNDPAVASLAGRLNFPQGLATDGTKLYIADIYNNRVLVYNQLPTVNGALADRVIGQPNLTTISSGVTQAKLNGPRYVYVSGTRIYVADANNHRVMVWNTFPTTDGANADFVLGQTSFTSSTANSGGISNFTGLNTPAGIVEADGKLLISEASNHRVLVWNTIPNASGVAANYQFGQLTDTGSSGAVGANRLIWPGAIKYLNNKLFILDRDSQRIVIYNSIPTSSASAVVDSVYGQVDVTGNTANRKGLSPWATYSPQDIIYDGSAYWVVDSFNHRLVRLSLP